MALEAVRKENAASNVDVMIVGLVVFLLEFVSDDNSTYLKRAIKLSEGAAR